MTLTALELTIIFDTLRSSGAVRDGADLFGFTAEARMNLARKVANGLAEIEVAVCEVVEE